LSCPSHHTGTLCILHVTLFENGVLHLQTEKVCHNKRSNRTLTLKRTFPLG
jgi:hypothetical protein